VDDAGPVVRVDDVVANLEVALELFELETGVGRLIS